MLVRICFPRAEERDGGYEDLSIPQDCDLFWAPLQHLELIKGCTPKTPPLIRNRKGIFFFF